MVNWQSIIFNSFWIAGLSVLLAGFSYHYWAAADNGRSFRVQLSQPGFLRIFWFAVILFSIGLAGTSQAIWEIVVWGSLALIALVSFAGLLRKP